MATIQLTKIRSKAYNQGRKAARIAQSITNVFPPRSAATVARAMTEDQWNELGDHMGYNGVSEETRHLVIAQLDLAAELADAEVEVTNPPKATK